MCHVIRECVIINVYSLYQVSRWGLFMVITACILTALLVLSLSILCVSLHCTYCSIVQNQ